MIIPVHNRAKMVTEAIDSVLSQGFGNYELIVVDDGSNDGTPERLEAYRDKVQIITQDNSGSGLARNRGAEAARGEYLVFLDSDDVLMPRALKVYDAIISKVVQPVIIVAKFSYFAERDPVLPTKADWDVEAVIYTDFLSKDRPAPRYTSCLVVRERIFHQLGGFVQMVAYEDGDFILRAGTCGPVVQVIKPITVGYRRHEGNASRNMKWMVQSIVSVIGREMKGMYPGSLLRMFDRCSFIGGDVFAITKRAFSEGYPILGSRLFLVGFPMVFAGAVRKLVIGLRGRQPTVKIRIAG